MSASARTGPQGEDGVGVPVGGTEGQTLAKASGTDFDTEWVDPPAGGGDVTQAELDAEAATRAAADTAEASTRAAADAALDGRVDALELAPPAHDHDDRYYTETEVDTALALKQPVDSDLTAIAALSTTAFGRALLALADAAAGRTAFGLGTAATAATGDFDAAGAAAAAQAASQPLDSDLTAIAALSTTSFGRSLLALADAAALLSAAGAQASDSDLTAIAGIAPTNDDLIQRKAGAWTNRTPAQVKTDLALVKGDVGLGNVDNTADTAKPVSTAQQTALDLKSNLASPTFTGDPKAPTPTAGDNDTSIATTAFVTTADGLLVPKSLVDAKGDLLVGTADNTIARKAVGTNGKFLKADSTQGDGLLWDEAPLGLTEKRFVAPCSPLLVNSSSAMTANLIKGVRVTIPISGNLRDLAVFVITASGNIRLGVYDTGEASAGNRSRLWDSGSVAAAGTSAWQIVGDPNLAVTQGQQLDLAINPDNSTVNCARMTFTGFVQGLPSGFWAAAGGASAKIGWQFASGAATLPTTISEANCSLNTTSVVYIIGRIS